MPVDYARLARQHGGQPAGGSSGLLTAGNIDLLHRPRVRNSDGSISTVRSFSVNLDGREVLLPTVSDDGRIMSEDEAIRTFQRTGRHLGMFDSPSSATAYAEKLHEDQARLLEGKPAAESGRVDYSALAAKFGGRADAPEHRIPAGIDPRVDWDMAFGDEEREAATKGALEAASGYAGMAGLATTSPAAAAVSGAVNAVSGHIPAAVLDVGLGAMPGGRLVKLGGKALLARLAHKVGRASKAAQAVEEAAPVVEKAASLSYRPGSAVPIFTEAAPNVVKMPIRLPAESASTVAEAAEAAEAAGAKATKAAKSARRAEPPVPEGHVRLYRGETAEELAKVRTTPSGSPDEATVGPGRWFTTDGKVAEGYAKAHKADDVAERFLGYVDVPKDRAAKYLSPSGHYFVPEEVAQKIGRLKTVKARGGADAARADYARRAEERARNLANAQAETVTAPVKGQSRLPTVYTRPPGTTPMTDAKYLQQSAKRSLAQQQAEAAKAAGIDVGEAFGTATPEISSLESKLRASVMPPQQLAQEIEAKVVSLAAGAGKKKLSAAALGKQLDELYGVGEKYGSEMAEMILRAHGLAK